MNQAHAIFGSPAHHMAIWCPLPTGVEYCIPTRIEPFKDADSLTMLGIPKLFVNE